MNRLNPILQMMSPISLEAMKSVQLMNRVDTKYLMNKNSLHQLFEFLKDNYYVQCINGNIIAPYKTLYYDTEDVRMYTAHHNRKLNRQKLRVRCYRQSQTTFCEIKNKNNKGKTKKLRISIPAERFNDCLKMNEVVDFVNENLEYELPTMMPHVENNFDRITLVNRDKTERITIDSNIRFGNRFTGNSFDISELVIIELKQDGFAPSLLRNTLQDFRISPKRVSKYCLGTILTNPDAKHNRFKRKLRYIEKIINSTFVS